MKQTSDMFKEVVLERLGPIFKALGAVRASVEGSAPRALEERLRDEPEWKEYREKLVQGIKSVEDDAWDALQNARRVDGRLGLQVRKVAARLAKQVQSAASKSAAKPKSEKRQAAGKRKATSLIAWHTEFSEARQALKDEGYTGTFKLKKGLPLYEKIQAKRRAKFTASAGSSS